MIYSADRGMADADVPSSPQLTHLLKEWRNGNQAALEQLMPLVYAELHRIARRYMAKQAPGHTLQTTALINEAYLRIAANPDKDWENRIHFFGVAASAMRHVLVDHARSSQAAKRGGGPKVLPLDETFWISDQRLAEVIGLDDALRALEKLHARQSRVVELR